MFVAEIADAHLGIGIGIGYGSWFLTSGLMKLWRRREPKPRWSVEVRTARDGGVGTSYDDNHIEVGIRDRKGGRDFTVVKELAPENPNFNENLFTAIVDAEDRVMALRSAANE